MRKSIIFWMPLEIDFWWNFGGFCEENGSKMAKIGAKIDLGAKAEKSTKR